jgi:site-specific DNA recombinase
MNRAIAIFRSSTDKQDLGIETQETNCFSFAKKNNLEVVETFSDVGVSGGAPIEKRIGLLNAISSLKKGDVLLCYRLDRIGRDPLLLLTVERMLEKKGCRLVSVCNEGTATDSPQDKLMRQMVVLFAEYERSVIRARISACLQNKKKKGERVGTIPFGYKMGDGNKLVECPDAQSVLSTVQEQRNAGKSWRNIVKVLNDAKIYNRRGREWNYSNLYHCCKGRVA